MAQQRSAEELEKLLQEAEQRAERERQRAEAAERERKEEQQRAERERQRAEGAEERIRHTTLDEYLAACHDLVFSRLAIETNPKLTSKGSITNPRDKWCPTNLRPWPDLLDEQRQVFGTLFLSVKSRVFENRGFLAGLGDRIAKRPIADERTLEYFLHNSVEDPVRAIIDELKGVQEVRRAFRIGDGVVFENHPHALSDVSEEVLERETPSTSRTPDHRRDLNQLRPDQICIYRSDDTFSARRTMIYVSEYKPPHKLTAVHLRLGLRPMNIVRDVVNRKTIPTSVDAEGRTQYQADKLTASAVTQTYHYMIESGLEYGLLTTGEAIVFLKVDWDEPETLYYHLAEPGPEALAHPNNPVCTAVGQYLAFTLTALGSFGHGQDERQKVKKGLNTWAQDFETTLHSIPVDERRPSPDDSSPFAPPTTYKDVDRSPYLLRRRQRIAERPMDAAPLKRDDESSNDDGDDDDDEPPRAPDTPSPASRTQEPRRSQRILARRPRAEGGGEERGQQYCTQRCLLGLVKGGLLDPACPNVGFHRQRHAATRHPVTHKQWLRLLWKQMKRTLDDGIVPLGLGGARGVLFKMTLLAYGYTFVGKGTVRAFIEDLKHEAAVYERLKPIQGLHVPVFLGEIDLRTMDRIYHYDHRVYVVHMTLLSFGGTMADDADLAKTAVQALRAMHQRGVIHKDVRLANMLFCAETGGVMMIDFERAWLLEPPRPPLGKLVPNKRRWKSDGKTASRSSSQRQVDGGISEDLWMAETAFLECHPAR